MTSSYCARTSRAFFITSAVAAGTGLYLGGPDQATAAVTAGRAANSCADTVGSILNTALAAEQIALTLYYTALSAPAVLHNRQLGGLSSNPNDPGLPPNGAPQHVRFLQAALDAEVKHVALLWAAGGRGLQQRVYFPPTTFARMGTSLAPGSFLGVVEILESTLSGIYIAAAAHFLQLGRHDLATLVTQLMGIEAEHRTLGRVIAGVHPPNNLTLEPTPFGCVSDADAVLRPFLTGTRFLFARDATAATPVPTNAQTRRVIGKYGTHRVRRFL